MSDLASKFNLNLDLSSGVILGLPWEVFAIILLVFFLILTLAQVRRHFIDWSFKGAASGVVIGFLLAIVVEGFLLVYGKTFIIQTLGWENAPKPVAVVLDAGKKELSKVLGTSIEGGNVQNTYKDVLNAIQSMNPTESKKVKSLICAP